MNQAQDAPWSQAEHFTQSDFSNFLDIDLDNIDFTNFTTDNGEQSQDGQQRHQIDQAQIGQHSQQSQTPDAHLNHANTDIFNFGFDPNLDPQLQHAQAHTQAFNFQHEPTFRPHQMVPPTPNSIEMHGDPARYLQMEAQNRHMMEQQEQRFHAAKGDSTYTPLVSPAVTPHDARFQMNQEYVNPNAYFSPLTSPAIEAQNQYQHHAPPSSAGSVGTSPINLDVDMLGDAAGLQPTSSRKPRKKPSAKMRQSPIARPQRRKTNLSATIPSKEVAEVIDQAQRVKGVYSPSHPSGLVPPSQDNSSVESISPEPISEALMGPPPKPNSAIQSPAILAQTSHLQNAGFLGAKDSNGVCPATPTSLMRLQQQQQQQQGQNRNITSSPSLVDPNAKSPPGLEDLSLPESATASSARPALTRLTTALSDENDQTPRLGPRKTPKLGALSTPSSKASPVTSPASPNFSKKSRAGSSTSLGGKKRTGSVSVSGNGSGSMISPALRPKISPNIKPLLASGPSGSVPIPGPNAAAEAQALLLASRSNYQNLIDGTTLPGVEYPETLSTNLTSKRTSHKIAEQGRRNRINSALVELQGLVPPGIGVKSPEIQASGSGEGGGGGGSGRNSASSSGGNSKAATVESAIEYIRLLKGRAEEDAKEKQEKDEEIAALKAKLASQGSEEVAELNGEADVGLKTKPNADEMDDG
ncbi:hypothetical protein K402DRAFT_321568 [Aulographum hederae CBS 113979]|uniref:BHLH domain-containing protein n=1 Tax=Aulographum hederae CBS 113979 TaxID=1176131 RepID=A0A6G1HFW7_9PEZI|nr:hypothetical protein K402DRAFT_321568 [Aulographum hederae CBS 113979]